MKTIKNTFITLFIIFSNQLTFCQKDNIQFFVINQQLGEPLKPIPDKNASPIGLLPYGTKVTIDKVFNESCIKNNPKKVSSKWIKINAYSLYKLLDSIEQYPATGYILKTSLDTIINSKVNIKDISENEFKNQCVNAAKPYKKREIKDVDSIKKILGERVDWIKVGEDISITSLQSSFGQRLMINPPTFYEMRLISYYPEDQILYMIGGNELDLGFSLITGEITGIPFYIVESPNNLYRINGTYDGMECVSYFLEKKVDNQWKFYSDFPRNSNLCMFKDFLWLSDNDFIFSFEKGYSFKYGLGVIPVAANK